MSDTVVTPGSRSDSFEPSRSEGLCVNSEELELLATYWLRRVTRRLAEAHTRAGSKLNVKPYEFAALSLIARNPGITSAQVSSALGMRRPNFVPILKDLEMRGYVMRFVHSGDGRAKGLVATEAGVQRANGLGPKMQQVESDALSALSVQESRALLALLRKAGS